jgi:hypothetical protein
MKFAGEQPHGFLQKTGNKRTARQRKNKTEEKKLYSHYSMSKYTLVKVAIFIV